MLTVLGAWKDAAEGGDCALRLELVRTQCPAARSLPVSARMNEQIPSPVLAEPYPTSLSTVPGRGLGIQKVLNTC